jgi:hypothetical protein
LKATAVCNMDGCTALRNRPCCMCCTLQWVVSRCDHRVVLSHQPAGAAGGELPERQADEPRLGGVEPYSTADTIRTLHERSARARRCRERTAAAHCKIG